MAQRSRLSDLDLALQHRSAGRRDDALRVCRGLLAREPDHVAALSLLGALELEAGRPADALPHLERAVRLNPNATGTLVNLGLAYGRAGALAEAAAILGRALALEPDSIPARYNLGLVCLDRGELDRASELLSRVLSDQPSFSPATRALAKAQARRGDEHARRGAYAEAVAAYRESLALDASAARVQRGLALSLLRLGNLEEALRALERALALDPTLEDAESRYVFHAAYSPRFTADDILRLASAYAERHLRAHAARRAPYPHDRAPERRLRIGYVSPDFREHPLRLFVAPVLAHHDAQHFEIHCYSSVKSPDAWTERIRALPHAWHDVSALDDAELAARIRADQIDLLLDLSMHMGENRLKTFAEKPAPVQIAWFAYPGTTGSDALDYRITDRFLDPPGTALPYAERSLWLPHSFWCYDPASAEPAVSELPALLRGRVTFGCLNNFLKVNIAVLELWARVLQAVPNSELLLLAPSEWARRFAVTELERHGISRDRVQFEGLKWRADYLKSYHRIDVALDCFPYNGHTTSFDAFWMGVPVVSLLGKTVVGRAGLCLAHHLELRELVAETADDYVRIARELAHDLPRLAALRAELRGRLARSVLMDAQGFTRALEGIYREAWRRFCDAPG